MLPGGVDSQIIEPDGTCRLSARYALQVEEGTVYVENNGIRRVPARYHDQLFADDMRFLALFRRKKSIFAPSPPSRWIPRAQLANHLAVYLRGRTYSGWGDARFLSGGLIFTFCI